MVEEGPKSSDKDDALVDAPASNKPEGAPSADCSIPSARVIPDGAADDESEAAVSDAYDEDNAAAWYAAAAAGDSDDESEPAEGVDDTVVSDPYLASATGEVSENTTAIVDPYEDLGPGDETHLSTEPPAKEPCSSTENQHSVLLPRFAVLDSGVVAQAVTSYTSEAVTVQGSELEEVIDLTTEIGGSTDAPLDEEPPWKKQRTRVRWQSRPPRQDVLEVALPHAACTSILGVAGEAHAQHPVQGGACTEQKSHTYQQSLSESTPCGHDFKLQGHEKGLELQGLQPASDCPTQVTLEQNQPRAQETNQHKPDLQSTPYFSNMANVQATGAHELTSTNSSLAQESLPRVSALNQNTEMGAAQEDEMEMAVEQPVTTNDDDMAAMLEEFDGELPWDEKVVVVRQGQVHIELQHRNPPMHDSTLLRFCDWLDQQMPLVVSSFPYVQKSGAYVDLSDNVIGPEGLDKLFRVLRDHRVPCVVMKAYRNVLTDSIVDTLIEYLYTQPESFPMHGIHISHNNISDKGAFRLVTAAAQCGHYPRLTSRLPLWLRLEANDIKNPHKILADCNKENFNVCLMGNGLCSRADCNHYSGVHVQLPYFLHQGRRGPNADSCPPKGNQLQQQQVFMQAGVRQQRTQQPQYFQNVQDNEPEFVVDDGIAKPDWMKKDRVSGSSLMVPAPKKQGFRPSLAPTPKVHGVGRPSIQPQSSAHGNLQDAPGPCKLMGMQRVVRPSMPPGSAFTVQETLSSACAKAGGYVQHRGDWEGGGNEDGAVHGDFGSGFHTQGYPDELDPMLDYTTAVGGNIGGDINFGSGMDEEDDEDETAKGWSNGFNKGRGKGMGRASYKGSGPAGQGGFKNSGKGFQESGKGFNESGKGAFRRGRLWQGPTLESKIRKDTRLVEGELMLGFEWKYVGEGHSPIVTSVVPGSQVSQSAIPGDSLLRLNGLDTGMFTEKQITDMLKQRPVTLRFGDE